MKEAIRLITADEKFSQLLSLLDSRELRAGGLTQGAASLVASALHSATGRQVLLVTPHIDLADDLFENVTLFLGDGGLLEPRGTTLSFEETIDEQAAASRVRLLKRYLQGEDPPGVVVASAAALLEKVPDASSLEDDVLRLTAGSSHSMEDVVKGLVENGFSREYEAERPWQFAVRGGILDVFAPGEDCAVRIEFFGDQVESIRSVDPLSGRSVEPRESVQLVTPQPQAHVKSSASFMDYLDDDSVIFVWEAPEVQRAAEAHAAHHPSSAHLVTFADVWKKLTTFTHIEASSFQFTDKGAIAFESRAFALSAQSVEEVVEEFSQFVAEMKKTFVFTLTEAEQTRLKELFAGRAERGRMPFDTAVGRLNHAFYFADSRMAFVGNQDVFHRYRMRRRIRAAPPTKPVEAITELTPGDYVVHTDNGIARFRGMEIVEKDERRREYLVLEFARKTRLLVPVSHIDLVSKYVGPSDRPPSLTTIGSKTWKARKARVARAVREMAAELLRLQAMRTAKPGIAFSMDEETQNEFENEFIYEETEDQLTALAEIKGDMLSPRPADRLLCGDVGFGKTELAIRAAFAAVSAGKQVAVLVPTTVLAEQHFRTFSERMADYPVLIEVLSRLRTKAEQRQTLDRLSRNRADIVIGTHRLVQRDVVFADLGLVIIDEEQRFGVEHKERLKRLRETVDVLTLTATPIPRTLHMALVGLRDISVLQTPPQARQAVSTFVGRLSPERLREVLLRELGREGQVYFVHNRVHSIEAAAERVLQAAPEARVTIAHGQMNEHLLAQRMLDFVDGRYDILVATTIIESGLDIPNVNTLIVDDADMFGLADLHQLRGRVGRYKQHAYAYFLLPEKRPITPEGRKRLEAIEHFSELGAGFKIAMRDMEIRGVGNVLGREQSGHVTAVGYELYCRLLSDAVSSLKGGETAVIPDTYIEFAETSFIPGSYIESPAHRLDLYKRLAVSTDERAVDALFEEISDRFGPPPPEVEEFTATARLRILSHRAGIRAMLTQKGSLVVQAGDIDKAAGALAGGGRVVRIVDGRTAHVFFADGLPKPRALIAELINILKGS